MIQREERNHRMSNIVKHSGVVYLSGQVGKPNTSIAEQTEECLKRIEDLLEKSGTDAKNILQATIWLADMSDFEAMNEVWDKWVIAGHEPARACGEAKLALPEFLVEIIVTAAY